MKTFPKPLTAKEEKEYLEKLKSGDPAVRNILVERNLRLVAHVIKKYARAEDEADDLLSIGTIGLIKAVNTFNPDKSSRLSTYAGRCIENEILMHFRTEKKLSREVSLYEPIGTDKEGNEISLIDVFEAGDEDVDADIMLKDDVNSLMAYMKQVLTERETEILRFRYGLSSGREMTQKELAKKYGISRSYVSRIEKRAIGKLKECFGR